MIDTKKLEDLKVKILKSCIRKNDAKISKFEGEINKRKEFLDGISIEYTVRIKKVEFLIVFQPIERTDPLEDYAEVGIERAIKHGYKSDESNALMLDENGLEILEILEDKAKKQAKAIFWDICDPFH